MSDEAPREFSYPASNHVSAVEKPAAAPATALTAEQPKDGQQQQQQQRPPSQVKPTEVRGRSLDQLPEELRKEREARQAATFAFAESPPFAEAIPIDPAWPEEQQRLNAELREIALDAKLTPQEVKSLADIHDAMAAEPDSDERRAAWAASSKAELQRQYGKDAGRALADASRWVLRDPLLAAWLDETGLGDHPAYIKIALRKAGWGRG